MELEEQNSAHWPPKDNMYKILYGELWLKYEEFCLEISIQTLYISTTVLHTNDITAWVTCAAPVRKPFLSVVQSSAIRDLKAFHTYAATGSLNSREMISPLLWNMYGDMDFICTYRYPRFLKYLQCFDYISSNCQCVYWDCFNFSWRTLSYSLSYKHTDTLIYTTLLINSLIQPVLDRS